jgi:hypothetical protein
MGVEQKQTYGDLQVDNKARVQKEKKEGKEGGNKTSTDSNPRRDEETQNYFRSTYQTGIQAIEYSDIDGPPALNCCTICM